MKNILVVNVNWLGDVVMSTPVFTNLRRAYPDAKICCLAVPRVVSVLEHVPEIDTVIPLREGYLSSIGMIAELKKHNSDVAFFLSRSKSRVLLTKLAGIKDRVGYRKDGHNRYLTHAVEEVNPQTMHRRDIYLNILDSYGIDITSKETKLKSSIHSNDGKGMVLFHVGANWNLKQWPLENFKRVMEKVNGPVGIIGTDQEKPMVTDLIAQVNREVFNFAGTTDIPQLIDLLSNVKALVTADSGPLHVASSLGTPVVGLFGPTSYELTGPCGSGKSILLKTDVGCNRGACYHTTCADNICMQAITVEDVLDGLRQI